MNFNEIEINFVYTNLLFKSIFHTWLDVDLQEKMNVVIFKQSVAFQNNLNYKRTIYPVVF